MKRKIFLLLIAFVLLGAGLAVAQDRVVTSSISIEQDQLTAGAYTVDEVLQAGRQFFAVPYIPADGHGEGDAGPRAAQRAQFFAQSLETPLAMPFLRMNGIDSQACFGCHNSAGTYVPPGQSGRTQKPGGVGGSADFASVLFANPEPFDQRLSYIVRVPPKSFGTAYAQELAIEMTSALHKIEAELTAKAAMNVGTPITGDLKAKGVSFGTLTITCPSAACPNPVRDTSGLDGISPDLIVRPLQHKGVAATLRSFSKSALDFHFSMQPVEVVGVNTDCDADGLINEMAVDVINPVANNAALPVQQSLGNVAALAAFAGMLRPPVTNSAADIDLTVELGRRTFREIGCDTCHLPSMTTRRNPLFRIELNQPAAGCPGALSALGSGAEENTARHPAVVAATADLAAASGSDDLAGGVSASVCPTGFYCINLTNPGLVGDEFLPRLPANLDGTVTVPMYSDLKRHNLGKFLVQPNPPQTDDAGNPIPDAEWLTTKLWGVADNGPWLHDGRARTLNEAILMHDGPQGNGPHGDAEAVIDNYQALPAAQQSAVIAFLESLRVPIP
ncbi:MAG: di-heme oxidoredictase family protein [Acidobacteriota bacterium]